MQGFVLLRSDGGHGTLWVRLVHVTAIGTVHVREGTGGEHHWVTVLAGGEWFRDPVDYPTEAAARARADELGGAARSAPPWRSRLRDGVLAMTRRRDPNG